MKRILLIFISLFFLQEMKAQITGADTVCLEYRYTYSVSISGAISYTWTLPTGWYILSGQGTNSVYVNVNTSVGQVCVTGFDAGGSIVGNFCKDVFWGGGSGTGWDAIATPVGPCYWHPSVVSIQPNGTGGGLICGSCSNGTPNPNLINAIYDSQWPFGSYQGEVSPFTVLPPIPISGIYTYYIYQIDTTPGINNAYLVEGGCGGTATINNVVSIWYSQYVPPVLAQSPDPVCVGDTVIVYFPPNPGVSMYWTIDAGSAIMISPAFDLQCTLVVTGNQFLQVSCNDNNWPCNFVASQIVNITTCASPVAAFNSNSTVICEQNCISFNNQSTGNATSWQWTFTGANTTSSTSQNPANICYNTPGTYDVQLIVCNNQGCDTLLLTNYITVNSNPTIPTVNLSTDTLFSNNGYATYAWYESGNPANVLSTDSFYVPTVTGNYFVVVSNNSGCSSTSTIYSFQGTVPAIAISASDTTFCEKNSLDFFDLSQNNPLSWQWFFPGASPDTSTLQNPTGIYYNTYGSYTVHLIACNINGCDSIAFTNFITVYQTPAQPLLTVSSDTLYCNITNVTYQWYNSLLPGQLLGTNNYYHATVAGNYYVVVTDTNGCEVSSDPTTITTGINLIVDDNFTLNYRVDSKSLLVLNNSFRGKINCTIVNALGQTILCDDFNLQNENLIIPFDYKPGIYLLKIEAAQNKFNYKFIVR